MMHGITIQTYRPELMSQVHALVSSVQQEYGVPVTIEQQPDLSDIENVYMAGNGNFWVALDNGKVIGSIALIDRGASCGIIRKMFLYPSYRGAAKGISATLLETLTAHASKHGITKLYLGTVDILPAASRFYEKNGFSLIAIEALPPHVASVRMAVDNKHYQKELAA